VLNCVFFLHLFHKDGSVSVTFPSVHAVQMIDSLAENVKMSSNDFRSPATNIHIFKNPPFVQVSDAA
jgi:hypothetical protein